MHHGEISTSISTGNCQVNKILTEFSDVFDSPSKPLSLCNLIECDIPTGDARPIRQRAYRTPLTKRTLIEDQINEMLEQGIIRPSSFPYASPVTLVPKKSGEYRFCVDYRKLNSVTIKDSFPLPLIQDVFDQLEGATDVVVFGADEAQQAQNLRLVLEQFRKYMLTVKHAKCMFSQSSLLLLGYTVSKDGISADPAKVQAITDLPARAKLSELRTFLGMSGHYRKLVPNYAKISHPLLELVKKNAEWLWTPERQ